MGLLSAMTPLTAAGSAALSVLVLLAIVLGVFLLVNPRPPEL